MARSLSSHSRKTPSAQASRFRSESAMALWKDLAIPKNSAVRLLHMYFERTSWDTGCRQGLEWLRGLLCIPPDNKAQPRVKVARRVLFFFIRFILDVFHQISSWGCRGAVQSWNTFGSGGRGFAQHSPSDCKVPAHVSSVAVDVCRRRRCCFVFALSSLCLRLVAPQALAVYMFRCSK